MTEAARRLKIGRSTAYQALAADRQNTRLHWGSGSRSGAAQGLS
ncbi:hypothetical protein [Actinomadura litoris]|nr:hypothetical protein [Actinomadura litoris]